MAAALALASRGRGRTGEATAHVGCIIVKRGRVVGRGWTQPGGRPHAEAMALGQAGAEARGADCYVTLEPCAHRSARGPACADLLAGAGIARLVTAAVDPDPRTAGAGLARLRDAGVEIVENVPGVEARAAMPGHFAARELGRPFVTLKLATSLDGCIALANGESRWITGAPARAHGHLMRALHEMVLVGRGTLEADKPSLDVRLPGLEDRKPRRAVLTSAAAPEDWEAVSSPQAIESLQGVHNLLIEGGAGAAAAFLRADLVDRVLLYRAPLFIGGGKPCLGDIGLASLEAAHGRWRQADARRLGSDTLEVYERA